MVSVDEERVLRGGLNRDYTGDINNNHGFGYHPIIFKYLIMLLIINYFVR